MKLFVRDDKVNFVDENNNFIGYCLEQQCYENAECELCFDAQPDVSFKFRGSNVPSEIVDIINKDLEDYEFETLWRKPIESDDDGDSNYHDNSVTFGIFKKGKPSDKGCIIFRNMHNGYYAHIYEYDLNIKGSGSL